MADLHQGCSENQSPHGVAVHGVYLITPDLRSTEVLLKATAAALAAGVCWLQYRHKAADAALCREQAQALRTLTRRFGARLVINDDAALALDVDADGVHIGRDDGNVAAVRAGIGPHRTIGVSCYDDASRADAARRAGANYVAFGSVFASAVKPDAVRAPIELLTRARRVGARVVAIGGINATNISRVAAAGAHAAALISAVYDAPEPAAAAARLVAEFERGAREYNETSYPSQ